MENTNKKAESVVNRGSNPSSIRFGTIIIGMITIQTPQKRAMEYDFIKTENSQEREDTIYL